LYNYYKAASPDLNEVEVYKKQLELQKQDAISKIDNEILKADEIINKDAEIKQAIELCLSASTQPEWLDYREELLQRIAK
jgi:hypothetical protein